MKKILFSVFAGLLLFVTCGENDFDPANLPQSVAVDISVSKINENLNAYCFQPVTFTISLPTSEERFIDSMKLHIQDGEERVIDLKVSAPFFTEAVVFADTGIHKVELRIFETSKKGMYRSSIVDVKIGLNYSASPIVTTMYSIGSDVNLTATGIKPDGVFWFWDLSRIDGDNVTTAENQVSVFVDQEYNDTVFLSQTDGKGRYSPKIAVPFKTSKTSYYPQIPFTLSMAGGISSAYCFTPITFTAVPDESDLRYIDSIVVSTSNSPSAPTFRLSAPSFSATFSYADTGTFTGRMRVFERGGGGALIGDTAFTIRVGMDMGYGGPTKILVDDIGTYTVFEAVGYRHESHNVFWCWDISSLVGKDSVIVSTNRDLPIFLSLEEGRIDNIELYQMERITVDGNVTQRRSPGVWFKIERGIKMYKMSFALTQTGTRLIGATANVTSADTLVVRSGADTVITLTPGVNTRIENVASTGATHIKEGDVYKFSAIRSDIVVNVTAEEIDQVAPRVEILFVSGSAETCQPYYEANNYDYCNVANTACSSPPLFFSVNKQIKSLKITAALSSSYEVTVEDNDISKMGRGFYWYLLGEASIGLAIMEKGDLMPREDRITLKNRYVPLVLETNYEITIEVEDTLGLSAKAEFDKYWFHHREPHCGQTGCQPLADVCGIDQVWEYNRFIIPEFVSKLYNGTLFDE